MEASLSFTAPRTLYRPRLPCTLVRMKNSMHSLLLMDRTISSPPPSDLPISCNHTCVKAPIRQTILWIDPAIVVLRQSEQIDFSPEPRCSVDSLLVSYLSADSSPSANQMDSTSGQAKWQKRQKLSAGAEGSPVSQVDLLPEARRSTHSILALKRFRIGRSDVIRGSFFHWAFYQRIFRGGRVSGESSGAVRLS